MMQWGDLRGKFKEMKGKRNFSPTPATKGPFGLRLKKWIKKKTRYQFWILLIRCSQDLGDLNKVRSASVQPDIRTLFCALAGFYWSCNRNLFGFSLSPSGLRINIRIRALDRRGKREVVLWGIYELKVHGNLCTILPGIDNLHRRSWEFCNLF